MSRRCEERRLDSPWIVANGEMISRHSGEIVTKEESSSRMLYSTSHFHHILHDFLDGSVGNRHVNGSDGHHEIYNIEGMRSVNTGMRR